MTYILSISCEYAKIKKNSYEVFKMAHENLEKLKWIKLEKKVNQWIENTEVTK